MNLPILYSKIWTASFDVDRHRADLCWLAEQAGDDVEVLAQIADADDLMRAATKKLEDAALVLYHRAHPVENPEQPEDWWKG